MVLLLIGQTIAISTCFGTMSFQMVLLLASIPVHVYKGFWNYVIPDGSTTHSMPEAFSVMFWNYVIPDGSTTDFGGFG